ncbi:MAG: hypothetical protein ABJG26_08490, partial [Marinomonas sp.]
EKYSFERALATEASGVGSAAQEAKSAAAPTSATQVVIGDRQRRERNDIKNRPQKPSFDTAKKPCGT